MHQAVILAGGEGSRLFPITSWTPKPLLPVRGVPVLVHILRKLKAEGWDEAVVCINEAHRDLFEYHTAHFETLYGMKIRLSTHPRSEEIGTAGELVVAARYIKGDRFLVHYGDILSKVDTAAMRTAFDEHNRPAALVAVANIYKTDKGIVDIADMAIIHADGTKDPPNPTITRIREKPDLELPNLMGIEILRSDVLEHLKIGEDLHRDVLPRLLQEGHPIVAHVVSDTFIDIGSVDAYRRAQSWR